MQKVYFLVMSDRFLYFLPTWLLGIPFNALVKTGTLSLGTYFEKFPACHLIFWILCKLNQTCNPIDAQKCTRSKLFCILQIIQEQDEINSARNIIAALNIILKNLLINWISIWRKLQDGIWYNLCYNEIQVPKSHIIQHYCSRTYLSNDILPIQCLQIDHQPRFCWNLWSCSMILKIGFSLYNKQLFVFVAKN